MKDKQTLLVFSLTTCYTVVPRSGLCLDKKCVRGFFPVPLLRLLA